MFGPDLGCTYEASPRRESETAAKLIGVDGRSNLVLSTKRMSLL